MGSFSVKQKRALKILRTLQKYNPHAHIALKYGNDIQLLVAVILSAQCTDKKVNEVTWGMGDMEGGLRKDNPKGGALFALHKTAADFAQTKVSALEKQIHPTGFYHAKAKNIIGATKLLQERYNGKLPRTLEGMTKLPGVGRKTAHIVLSNAFGIVEGIPVDTHVRRLSRHFGWTIQINPDKIEQDLMKLLPRSWWGKAPYLLIDYGRTICTARKCQCANYYLKHLWKRD